MPVSCDIRQCWRDLQWAINSPELIQNGYFSDAECGVQTATIVDFDNAGKLPEQLFQQVQNNRSQRLGHYFETLWSFYLTELSDWTLLSSNQQIYDDKAKNTAGAFDFIVRSPSDEIEHWELAVKFYLGTEDQQQNINWIGPNKIDNFDRKLKHLQNKQLQLSSHPAAKEWLIDQQWSITAKRVISKGYMFYHRNKTTAEAVAPPHSNGNWMYWHEWLTVKASYCWMMRDRHHWFGKRTMDELLPVPSEVGEQPILLSAFDSSGRELQRCFVCADDWLDI